MKSEPLARYETWNDRGEETGPHPWEDPKRTKLLTELYQNLLSAIGEDPGRDGLLRTPIRAARALQFLTQGYHQTIDTILNDAIFDEPTDGIVIIRDIEFYSLCEHHVLPFFGRCHVAYLPQEKIIGLSKIPRLVDMFARRLQVQERLTRQVAEAIDQAIQPRGVAVVTEAAHMCMMLRGVEKQHSSTVTSYVLGAFRDDPTTRNEFFNLIQGANFRID